MSQPHSLQIPVTTNINWLIVSLEDDYSASDEQLPQDPLVGFLKKRGGKFNVEMGGDGAVWGDVKPGELIATGTNHAIA